MIPPNTPPARPLDPAQGNAQHGNNPLEVLPRHGTGTWRDRVVAPDLQGDECVSINLSPPHNTLVDPENRISDGTVTIRTRHVTPRVLFLMRNQAALMQIRNWFSEDVLVNRDHVNTLKRELKEARAGGASHRDVSRLKAELEQAKKDLATSVSELAKHQSLVNQKHQELQLALRRPWYQDPRSRNRVLRVAFYALAVAVTFSAVRQLAAPPEVHPLDQDLADNLEEIERLVALAREHAAAHPEEESPLLLLMTDAILMQLREIRSRSDGDQSVMLAASAAMVVASICWIIERRFAGS
jgi:hypothetical protein